MVCWQVSGYKNSLELSLEARKGIPVSTAEQAVTQRTSLTTALWSNGRARTLGRYMAALALCVLVLGTVLDVRSEARMWPYYYRGDTMFYHLITKSVIDHGWFLNVPLLGAPEALNLRDVPTSDNNLHALMLWLLALNTSHYPSVLNNFFLLSFPLVFLSALWVLRHFGVAWWTGVCVSMLYTFAPFHFTRGEHHLFLSAYWPIPLAVLVMLWVSGDGFQPERVGRSAWRNRKLWLSVLICLVLAATGYYYAFFACFFFLVAGVVAAVRQRTWRGLWPGLVLIAVVGTGVAINLSPTLLRFEEQGTLPAVRRVAGDADSYGLRIAQLLLPVRGHRLAALEHLKAEYSRRPLINENDDVSLGLAGALGFVGLLWWFFFRKPAAEGLSERGAAGLLHHLSIFNLAGLLFGTIGGFGSLVAFFGLPQVRAYSRIGVFLSFFAFFALALGLDAMARRYAANRPRAIALGFVLAVVTVLALCDQISPKVLPDYKRIKAEFTSDAVFVREIEQNVPHGALILQLPFMTFPESSPVSPMHDYDLLRGYLHSDHLRWTYGTTRGREGNVWVRQTVATPADQLVETLAWAGFSGIYLDRNGFKDNGEQIEKDLRNALGGLPIHSPDERRVFYGLTEYRARLEQRTPPGQREAKREAALHPPLTVWQEGFFDQEGTPEYSWRWGESKARMTLVNRASRTQHVRLETSVTANTGGRVTIHTPLFHEPVSVKGYRQTVDKTFALPPGEHVVHFASDAPHAYPPNDFRDLVFGLQNFKLTLVQAPPAQSTPSAGIVLK